MSVDNHNVQAAVAGELVYLGQLAAVIDEALDTLAVFTCKMLAHHLKRLANTLADCYAGHYHYKLAPSIEAVQLEHRLDVGVGLAGARLHFNGEPQVRGIDSLRRFQLRRNLYVPDIIQKPGSRNCDRLVAVAHDVEGVYLHILSASQIVGEFQHSLVTLSSEHAGHCRNGFGLELLVLEFQGKFLGHNAMFR